MMLRGKKLGLLISAAPGSANFSHGMELAEAALNQGVEVYLYCIDEAVGGLANGRLQELKEKGVKLHACAYAAQRLGIPMDESAVFSGLSVVHDLCTATDRFVSFN